MNRAVLLVAVACLCACAPSVVEAPKRVTDSQPDTGDPGVVGILFHGKLICTGTVVSPRVVVTAAHCAIGDPPAYTIFFGAVKAAGGTVVPVTDVRVHPKYDWQTLDHDVALMAMAMTAPEGTQPWPLLTQALDSSFVNQRIRLVGFGLTGSNQVAAPAKRVGFTFVDSYDAEHFLFSAHPSQTCSGDSGGPAFVTVDGREYLAGTTSSGDDACVDYGRDTRVDIHVDDFLAPYIASAEAADAAVGAACVDDQSCASGICLRSTPDDLLGYCSTSCTGSEGCPPAMRCEQASDGGMCRLPPPVSTQGCQSDIAGGGQVTPKATLFAVLIALWLAWRRRLAWRRKA